MKATKSLRRRKDETTEQFAARKAEEMKLTITGEKALEMVDAVAEHLVKGDLGSACRLLMAQLQSAELGSLEARKLVISDLVKHSIDVRSFLKAEGIFAE